MFPPRFRKKPRSGDSMLNSPSKKSSRVFASSSSSSFLVNERNNTSARESGAFHYEKIGNKVGYRLGGRMSIKRPLRVSMAACENGFFEQSGRWWKMEDEEKKEGVQPLLNEPFSFLGDRLPSSSSLFAPIRGLNHGEKTLNTRDIFPWPEIGGHRCGTKEVVGLTRACNTKIVENRGDEDFLFFNRIFSMKRKNLTSEAARFFWFIAILQFIALTNLSLQFTRSKFCFSFTSITYRFLTRVQFSTISFRPINIGDCFKMLPVRGK